MKLGIGRALLAGERIIVVQLTAAALVDGAPGGTVFSAGWASWATVGQATVGGMVGVFLYLLSGSLIAGRPRWAVGPWTAGRGSGRAWGGCWLRRGGMAFFSRVHWN